MERPGTQRPHDTLVLGPARGVPGPTTGPLPWAPQVPPGWTAPRTLPDSGWDPVVPPGAPPVILARNNAAVIGATLGSVSLFLSVIPLIGIAAWLLAPLGMISSAIGCVVGMSRRVGRVGALWGLATSGLALVICFAWVALVLAL